MHGTRTTRKHTATEERLSREELRDVPGAFGDPGRAMEALPGVTTMASILPFYFVRGATPANTGYFVDGVRVPFISHAPPGSSFVPPGLIDKAHFYPGAAPARFGRVVGGTMDIDLRPPSDRVRGDAGVRLYDSYALVESPFGDQNRGSAAVAGRLGYSQLLLSALSNERQSYWDYTTRVGWKIAESHDKTSSETISALVMGSHDFAGTKTAGTRFDTEFHRVDLRYDVLRDRSATRIAATFGSDVSGNGDGNVRDRIFGLRAESTIRMSRAVSLEVGSNVTWDRYTTEVLSPTVGDPNLLFAPRDDIAVGAYGQLDWHPIDRLEIDAGMRVDLFASKRNEYPFTYLRTPGPPRTVLPPPGEAARIGFSPRVTSKLNLTSSGSVAYIASFGVAHQPPSFLLPGLLMSRLDDGLQTAVQSSQGLETRLPLDLHLTTTLFRHDYIDLNDAGATCPRALYNIFDPTDPCYARRVRGRAVGLEVMLKRSFQQRLTGWISYTLSRTTREAHALGESVLGYNPEATPNVLSEWDRTHVLSALAAYDFGRGWRGGARFAYNTGRPYSHTIFGVLVPPYTSVRLPSFYRIDVRLEKRWRLPSINESAYIAAVLEGFNVTLSAEALRCRSATPPISIRVPERIIQGRPFDACTIDNTEGVGIPSIGVEGAF